MYHYVRTAQRTEFPQLHSLSEEMFNYQLNVLQKDYRVITWESLVEAIKGTMKLPDNAAFLTFDDGLVDHCETVLPELTRRGLTAAFFPTAAAARDRKMLDVHCLQFVLAACDDYEKLAERLDTAIEYWRRDIDLDSPAVYRERYHSASRFDGPVVSYVKKTLQRDIPEAQRTAFLEPFFHEFVSTDEKQFIEDLYLNVSDLNELRACGMTIGHHGASHRWLNHLSKDEAAADIEDGCAFLKSNNLIDDEWCISYPFGGINDDVVEMVKRQGATAGFTVKACVANLDRDDPMVLPRLDTNDLPRA